MKVFKFGGASVNSIERIQNVAKILTSYRDEKILIVVSAIGKTTNSLEKVAEAFYSGNSQEALQLFRQVKKAHSDMAKYLLVKTALKAEERLESFYTEVEWLLHDKPVRDYDYYYDQIVSIGELLSTTIFSASLEEAGLKNEWIDVRDIFRTDDNFRDASINWNYTSKQVIEKVIPLFEKCPFVVTQGFIGSTDENESTTLGREGSDYSAAVFANILNAESQTIWKDVEGVMNADPKIQPDAVFLKELNYDEVIEMAYYGAQVIHPKTIKPLQNKGIPLIVKCFLDASLPGTIIHNNAVNSLPPIIIWKYNQVKVDLHTTDFSFVNEKPAGLLYQMLNDLKLKPNLTQSGAVSMHLCIDDNPERLEKLAIKASELFDVELEKNLTLLTIRHYSDEVIQKLSAGKTILLRQQTPETIQMLMK
ncbi:aspartate kinase [Pollutibacter soli]|uniref:aspartate kinase n=1 Tax=Pollutibacter soli TaxID=3034157 RepID=UPI003013AEDB